MANATSTGEIRPAITNTVHLADGTTQTATWVRLPMLVKRIRRHLAKRKHSLLISSEGTQARVEYGQYAVLDEHQQILSANCHLPDLARFLGVLADDEIVEPPANVGWRFHVARKHSGIVDGQTVKWLERLTRDYRTERAARKALENMEDRAGLVIIGDDARDDYLETMAGQWEREQQARQQAALAELEAAIDANPILRRLRSPEGCPQAWGAAQGIDTMLQKSPDWSEKPVADRLAEVVRLLAVNGLVASESEVLTHVE